jgi:hypothetical protein
VLRVALRPVGLQFFKVVLHALVIDRLTGIAGMVNITVEGLGRRVIKM